jgi:Xaa-Pro aminopeptidase
VEAVEPGMKEYELVGVIHGTYLYLGGSLYGAAIGVSPMDNPSAPYSWWVAGGSTREIKKGDLVLTEITGTYYGYPGQLIRPIALGDPPPELRKMADLAIDLYLEVQKVVKVGNTPRDVYRCSQRILDEGYTIQCPVIHGYSQVLQPPFASVPNDPCWSVMLDEPFRENQLIVIEANQRRPICRGAFSSAARTWSRRSARCPCTTCPSSSPACDRYRSLGLGGARQKGHHVEHLPPL